MSEKQCWSCIFGMNIAGGISCTNGMVNALSENNKPDPYDCEFYEEISDSYTNDIEKLEAYIYDE